MYLLDHTLVVLLDASCRGAFLAACLDDVYIRSLTPAFFFFLFLRQTLPCLLQRQTFWLVLLCCCLIIILPMITYLQNCYCKNMCCFRVRNGVDRIAWKRLKALKAMQNASRGSAFLHLKRPTQRLTWCRCPSKRAPCRMDRVRKRPVMAVPRQHPVGIRPHVASPKIVFAMWMLRCLRAASERSVFEAFSGASRGFSGETP